MNTTEYRSRRAQALDAIEGSGILDLLVSYNATAVSTLLVELDTDGSDIDVVCDYVEQKRFAADFQSAFQEQDDYKLSLGESHALGRFRSQGFLFEVYASPVPVAQQAAYRHYGVMQRLVQLGGETLQSKILSLKYSGLKTEPAISRLLQLEGDPYQAVLELENWSDADLQQRVATCLEQP